MPGVTDSNRKSWSDFSFTPQREESLKMFLLPREKYKRYGYRTEVFSHEELLHKYEAYCKRCEAFALKPDDSVGYREQLKCRIHPGRQLQQDQIWSCCRSTTVVFPGQPSGCRVFDSHAWTSDSALPRGFWDLHHTPPFKPSARSKQPRKVVSLDCEMATNRFDQPELIKLTLIDIFTKEVLIDLLVKPLAKIKNMLTYIHGITYKDILSSSNASRAILGRDAAREKIFEFVGPDTMVFVHGGRNDFTCLRWIHKAVIDTQEVESRVKRIGDDELDDWLDDEGTGLEPMCRLRTGIQIRCGRTEHGKGVHDSLEDAMACRELGIWYANNLKGEIGQEMNEEDSHEVVLKVGKNQGLGQESQPDTSLVQRTPALERGGIIGPVTPVVPHIPLTAPKSCSSPPSTLPKVGQHDELWECKVCQLKVTEATKMQHRTEKSHIDKLIKLVQRKGG